ncbi:hypothetical protein F2P79_008602 [Pimephales promelas]|nr:hypothetical protein F2P79_008602 [Pimephales promelas]
MQKRRTTQGLQRKTECENRSLIAMQMTQVYPSTLRMLVLFRHSRSGWQLSAPIPSTALCVPSRSSRNS